MTFLPLLAAAVALVLGGVGATIDTGRIDVDPTSPTAGGRPDIERLRAPLLQLVSPAGRQDAMRGSSCVSSVNETGEGVAICVDTLRPYPERLTVSERSAGLAFVLSDGDFTEPATVSVSRLGCNREVASFTLEQSGATWPADLPEGAYGLDVFFRFATPEGLSGDSHQSLGLLVEEGSEAAIVPATAKRFVCPREFRPQLVHGGTRSQRAVLTSTLDRLTASYAPTIRIAKPPRAWRPRNGTWLRVRVAAGSAADAVLPAWQGLLAVGAFRDHSLSRLAGYALHVDTPPERHERRAADGPAPATAPSAAVIRETVTAAVTDAGVRLDSLVMLRPLGPAPVVIVTVSDPERFLRDDATVFFAALSTLVDGAGADADGLYVELRDPAGHAFKISAIGTRAGSGAGWIREDLEPRDPTGSVGSP